MIVAVAAGAFLPPPETAQRFWSLVFDAAHFLAFGAVVWLVYRALGRDREKRLRHANIGVLVALVLAVGIEIAQPYAGRTGSALDLIVGILGMLFAWAAIVVLRRRRHPVGFPVLVAAWVVTFGLLLVPAMFEGRAVLWVSGNFPLLADFETTHEMPLWSLRESTPEIERSEIAASHGELGLRWTVPPGERATLGLHQGGQNWDEYRVLRLDVYHDSVAKHFQLIVIDDSRRVDLKGRFTARIRLEPGWNALEIPLHEIRRGGDDRRLNLRSVYRVMFVTRNRGTTPATIYLDHLRLE